MRFRNTIGLLFGAAVLTSCGYTVEPLSGTANTNISGLSLGDTFTLEEVFETSCESVTFVGAYMSNAQRDELIGRASVSMEGQGRFILAAAFDAEGDRVAAVRFARIPFDFDDLGGQTVPCDFIFEVGETRP